MAQPWRHRLCADGLLTGFRPYFDQMDLVTQLGSTAADREARQGVPLYLAVE